MTNILYKFTKDKKGNPVGVVCAYKINSSNFSLGWAKVKKGDKFNKQFGLKIAKDRATMGSITTIPSSLQGDYQEINERAIRYFRGCTYVNPKIAPKGFFATLASAIKGE
jgi:hypothetical protein